MAQVVLRAEMALPGADIQVIDYEWPTAHRGWDEVDRHVLSLSLSPVPPASLGRFDGMTSRPQTLGAMLFMPSRVRLEAACDGGFQRIVRCRFAPGWFEALTQHDSAWSEQELTRSQDLHSAALRNGLRRLASEVCTPNFGSTTVAEALTEMLAVDLIRGLAAPQGGEDRLRGGLPPHKLRSIEQRIAAPGLDLPSASELAADAGLSCRHLLRAYRESTGMGLRERLQREGQSRAQTLLADTALPIKEIAFRLGFRSPGSFSTAFRRATGESPRDYRLHLR